MLFRTLGNTGLSLSVIGLGGHWRTNEGKRFYDRFSGDEVPADLLHNRREVVAACLDAGINYLDVTTAAEALVYGRVLQRSRDRLIIGADDYQWSARNLECCRADALVANVERCLARLRTDRLDLWRVTSEVHGRNSDAQIEAIIEAAGRLVAAGKVRFLGVSAHHPEWIRRTVACCPAFEVAIVPCTPLSCLPAAPVEPMRTFLSRGVGVLTIKPFAGGLLFGATAPSARADELAGWALRHILDSRPEITSVLAGMSTVEEVSLAVQAANAPPLSEGERETLLTTARGRLGNLPDEYGWLAAWQGT